MTMCVCDSEMMIGLASGSSGGMWTGMLPTLPRGKAGCGQSGLQDTDRGPHHIAFRPTAVQTNPADLFTQSSKVVRLTNWASAKPSSGGRWRGIKTVVGIESAMITNLCFVVVVRLGRMLSASCRAALPVQGSSGASA